ncbi:MAG: hypothetical protein AAF385_08885 [Pseudomonadota bacterium]
MNKARVVLATLIAPAIPILLIYGLTLIMDGPDPVTDNEIARVSLLLLPAVLLAYPWSLLGGAVIVVVLRVLDKFSLGGMAIGGFLLGAIPAAIGAARSDALPMLNAIVVFGLAGLSVMLGWYWLSGFRSQGKR